MLECSCLNTMHRSLPTMDVDCVCHRVNYSKRFCHIHAVAGMLPFRQSSAHHAALYTHEAGVTYRGSIYSRLYVSQTIAVRTVKTHTHTWLSISHDLSTCRATDCCASQSSTCCIKTNSLVINPIHEQNTGTKNYRVYKSRSYIIYLKSIL